MTLIKKDFDAYSINYHSRKTPAPSNLYALISCYNGPTHEHVGTIWFFDTQPQDSSYTNNKISMFFDISRFNDIINILRYEKPFRIYFDDSTKDGWIRTFSFEPVGEQEPQ